jgi:hypothetical protein
MEVLAGREVPDVGWDVDSSPGTPMVFGPTVVTDGITVIDAPPGVQAPTFIERFSVNPMSPPAEVTPNGSGAGVGGTHTVNRFLEVSSWTT